MLWPKFWDRWIWFDDDLPERRVRDDAGAGGDPLQPLGIHAPPPPKTPEFPPKELGPYRTKR